MHDLNQFYFTWFQKSVQKVNRNESLTALLKLTNSRKKWYKVWKIQNDFYQKKKKKKKDTKRSTPRLTARDGPTVGQGCCRYACSFPLIRSADLVLACCCCCSAAPQILNHSKKFLSSLKFIFLFFCLCHIADCSALVLCPLRFIFYFILFLFLWTVVSVVFVSCGFLWTGVLCGV